MTDTTIEALLDEDTTEALDEPIQPTSIIEQILTAPTPPKPIWEYTQHPLNWDGEESTAHIIRGLEGILGNLDRAVIELIKGVGEKTHEYIQQGRETQ